MRRKTETEKTNEHTSNNKQRRGGGCRWGHRYCHTNRHHHRSRVDGVPVHRVGEVQRHSAPTAQAGSGTAHNRESALERLAATCPKRRLAMDLQLTNQLDMLLWAHLK